MEVQETISGTTRMNPDDHDILYHSAKLHPRLQPFFKPEMIRIFDSYQREFFVSRANKAYEFGMSKGMKTLICERRAIEFLLWSSHQGIDINPKCKYCPFLDSIYGVLDSFFHLPQTFEFSVVKIT